MTMAVFLHCDSLYPYSIGCTRPYSFPFLDDALRGAMFFGTSRDVCLPNGASDCSLPAGDRLFIPVIHFHLGRSDRAIRAVNHLQRHIIYYLL